MLHPPMKYKELLLLFQKTVMLPRRWLSSIVKVTKVIAPLKVREVTEQIELLEEQPQPEGPKNY
jgi:hypothetical protein